MTRLGSTRLFVLSALRPPFDLDPMPVAIRARWTFGSARDHVFRPIDLVDRDGAVIRTRFALELPMAVPIAEGQEFAYAIQGALALFMREAPLILAGAADPTEGCVDLDTLVEQMADDFDVDKEIPFLELVDLEGPPDRMVCWLLRALAPSVPARTLAALRAFDHSVRARTATYGTIGDNDVSALTGASLADSTGLASALVHAYRAIELQLGGPLPARANKAKQSLLQNGYNPSARLRNDRRLDDELQHAEAARGPAAHGTRAALAPADLVRAQILARYLLLTALGALR